MAVITNKNNIDNLNGFFLKMCVSTADIKNVTLLLIFIKFILKKTFENNMTFFNMSSKICHQEKI